MSIRLRARATIVAALASSLAGCSGMPAVESQPVTIVSAPAISVLTPAERAAGWRLLFDGTGLSAWRGYQRVEWPDGWRIESGALTKDKPADDIVSTEQFGDVELRMEWKLSDGG